MVVYTNRAVWVGSSPCVVLGAFGLSQFKSLPGDRPNVFCSDANIASTYFLTCLAIHLKLIYPRSSRFGNFFHDGALSPSDWTRDRCRSTKLVLVVLCA